MFNWFKRCTKPKFIYRITFGRCALNGSDSSPARQASNCETTCTTYKQYKHIHENFFEHYPFTPPILSYEEFTVGMYDYEDVHYRMSLTKIPNMIKE